VLWGRPQSLVSSRFSKPFVLGSSTRKVGCDGANMLVWPPARLNERAESGRFVPTRCGRRMVFGVKSIFVKRDIVHESYQGKSH